MGDLVWLVPLLFTTAAFFILWRVQVAERERAEREARISIAECQESVEALEAQVGELATAVESSESLLLVIDDQYQVRLANLWAQEKFGPLDGNPSLISYSQSLQLEQLVSDALDLPEGGAVIRVISMEDRPHRVVARISSELVGVSITDIAEFYRLSRARQEMIANLSHELRTPLTSLRLLTDTLNSPAGKDEQIAVELIEKIGAEVDELEQMAQEMLDLSAIESGKQVVRMVAEPLREILYGPIARVEDQAKRKHVKLNVRVPGELKILVDRDQASRAVLNVLHNAVKFTASGSEVSIQAWSDDFSDDVIISITDQGPGVHPAEIDRIFERFFRGDRARVAPGTGLGLAIVRHIMRAHGGSVWAENREPPDIGAIFYLAFQRA
jgi:two-component system phosphate regulon sensor histidine kinase PhoR